MNLLRLMAPVALGLLLPAIGLLEPGAPGAARGARDGPPRLRGAAGRERRAGLRGQLHQLPDHQVHLRAHAAGGVLSR